MRRPARDPWQPVPFAWLPVTYEGTTYWLERPPYERKRTGIEMFLDQFAYRRVGESAERWRQWC